MPDEPRVELSTQEGVAVLILRNPPGNRLTRSMVRNLAEHVAEVEKDEGVRAVLVSGEGDFCAGVDLDEWAALTPKEAQDEIQRGFEALWALEHLTKPTVAAISGRCEGAGLELALACDLRVSADNAVFALPQVDLAWMPSHGGTARLPRLVGRSRAMELLLTGKRLKALDALRYGLVDHLAASGEADREALALAQVLAGKSRAAVRAIKRAVTQGEEKPYRNRFLLEAQHAAQLLGTEDYERARASIRGKRK
jgi:enoyl-CoA hydratase/carnithine racemase